MANIAADGNHTTVQELSCRQGINGLNQKISLSVFNILTSITAFLGNVVIIVALQKVSSLHLPSKLLFQSLSSTDLCVGLITQPLYVYSTLMPPAHSLGCKYTLTSSSFPLRATGWAFCAVSLLTTTAISVDRLLALIVGIRYRNVVTLTRVLVFIVISWLFAIAIGLSSYFYTLRVTISLSCTIALLCVVTSTICYTKIYLKLRSHQTDVQRHVHQRQLPREGIPINVARYRKTVSNALWVQSTLFVCYLPYGILTVKSLFTGLDLKSDPAWHATLCLVFLNSSLNPFLYCWKMREVRQAVKNLTRKCWCFLS